MCQTLENEREYKLWDLPWKTRTHLCEKLAAPRWSVESYRLYCQGKSYQKNRKGRVRDGWILLAGKMVHNDQKVKEPRPVF